MDLAEVSTVGRSNLNRSSLHKKDAHLKSVLKHQAEFICKNSINEDYIRMAVNKYDAGYIYRDAKDTVLGFCIWKTYSMPPKSKLETVGERYLYILLMCAHNPDVRLGSYMLNDVEQYCVLHNIPEIRLEPMNEQLQTYYEKFGYIAYREGKKIMMIKLIQPMILHRNVLSKTRKRIIRRTDSISP